jgi:hypothetical protein
MQLERYLVVVDAEFDSEWYLTPMSFSSHYEAFRHAYGIAASWRGLPDAPQIWIKGHGHDYLQGPWSVEGLLFEGLIFQVDDD